MGGTGSPCPLFPGGCPQRGRSQGRWQRRQRLTLLPWGLGNISLEKSKRKKPCAWLPDQGWEDIMLLSELFSEDFGSLPDDVEKHPAVWKEVSPPLPSPPPFPPPPFPPFAHASLQTYLRGRRYSWRGPFRSNRSPLTPGGMLAHPSIRPSVHPSSVLRPARLPHPPTHQASKQYHRAAPRPTLDGHRDQW